MNTRKYTIGVDFGTESGRVLLVDVANGQEIATSVYPYPHGVISETLPDTDIRLERDWALHDPNDYLEVLKHAIPEVLKESGVDPDNIIGLGLDATSCSMLPTTADGTPLSSLPEWRNQPHAWLKLWKHHAAQPEASKLYQIAQEQGYTFLDLYGGKVNSEWFVPKAWQILNEAPEIYNAAGRLIEVGDWLVWQLTGEERRSESLAGYKVFRSKRDGFPPDAFFKALDPRMEHFIDEKMTRSFYSIGAKAGGLTEEAARWSGLKPGTTVAVANIDAHVSVPAATVFETGTMTIIMGTSSCHMVLTEEEHSVPGIQGCVEDGIIPGLFGYEAGQSCVGDSLAWFVKRCVPASLTQEAEARDISVYQLLEEKATLLQPGESGLLALDWWNGNRSVLVDANLSSMLLGVTLATRPEEIYRAFIEATAFGTRKIIDTFEAHGVPSKEIMAIGGLADRSPLFVRIYADVTGRQLHIAKTSQGGALGSAMHAAVAAGSYATIGEASKHMSGLRDITYTPIPQNQHIYDQLYAEYVQLHDYFGRGGNDVMKRLKHLREKEQEISVS